MWDNFENLTKVLAKFGGLEAILAIRNIKIDMKLKVAKSNKIMNICRVILLVTINSLESILRGPIPYTLGPQWP